MIMPNFIVTIFAMLITLGIVAGLLIYLLDVESVYEVRRINEVAF